MFKIQLYTLLFAFILTSSAYLETYSNRHFMPPQHFDPTIGNLYKSIELNDHHSPDWDLLRSLFMDGAHLIHVTESDVYKMSLEEFISNYQEQIDSGSLTAFKEYEIHQDEESFGNIVHVFSTYEAAFTTPDGDSKTRGINSIQLMKTEDKWKIVSIIWFDETDNNPISPEYLPKQDNQ